MVLGAGETTLAVGTDLGDVPIEVVLFSSVGAEALGSVTNARSGQFKVFVMTNSNITFTHNDSYFDLNGAADLGAVVDDVLCLLNIGGVPGVDEGYWLEVFRTLHT